MKNTSGSFFQPNIGIAGRLFRAVIGVVCLGFAAQAAGDNWTSTVGWGLTGACCLYEASRGWCLGRACGLRTPL